MTRHATLVLEHERLHVVPGAPDRRARTVPWNPREPAQAVEAIRDALADGGRAPGGLTLLVGLAFLEIARPELPPVSPTLQQQMLRADRERFFVNEGPIATTIDGPWAMACDAALLHRWCDAFEQLAPVLAVMALPVAVRKAGLNGSWQADAAPGETGLITVANETLHDVRRRRLAVASDASLAALDVVGCARALGGGYVPAEEQLLDTSLHARLTGRERRRLWRAAIVAGLALITLAWAADQRQTRTLTALEAERERLEALAGPPRAAQTRLLRAVQERQMLDVAATASRADAAPLAVLARLGTLIPPDAFVHRLEWNGTRWRMDGSATNASRLVPLLDGDETIEEVQSLAPSTRFLDAGRARNSFSIGFGVRAASPDGGSSRSPRSDTTTEVGAP